MVRELALHLLDIIENSLRAGASLVHLAITLDNTRDQLQLRVEDNGPGLPVEHNNALNPFFTTKEGKRTGLGLSLFQAAAQQAGGNLSLDTSDLGGLCVNVTLEYTHIDRAPLGDMPGTLMTLALSNPEVCFVCDICGPGGAFSVNTVEYSPELLHKSVYAAASAFADAVTDALHNAGIKT